MFNFLPDRRTSEYFGVEKESFLKEKAMPFRGHLSYSGGGECEQAVVDHSDGCGSQNGEQNM